MAALLTLRSAAEVSRVKPHSFTFHDPLHPNYALIIIHLSSLMTLRKSNRGQGNGIYTYILQKIQSYEDTSFSSKNWAWNGYFAKMRFFFSGTWFSCTSWPISLFKIKKMVRLSQELWCRNIFKLKMAHLLWTRIFFRKNH